MEDLIQKSDLIQKLDAVLRSHFPGAKPELEPLPPLPKVTGLVSWDGFEGQDQVDRQHNVWNVIREAIPAEEQRWISVILTVTPGELAYMREQN